LKPVTVESPPDRYAVIGNPVAHSRSPAIHAAFARQTGQAVAYGTLLAPLDGFAQTVAAFRAAGGRGANVTVPFKFAAFALADTSSARARRAGAANTLLFCKDGGIDADNTDGVGLVADLQAALGDLRGSRGLVVGAGGAVAGVLPSLVDAGVARLVLLNRDPAKAQVLADAYDAEPGLACRVGGLDASPEPVDWLLNGTSIGLTGGALPLTDAWFAQARLAYDMLYGVEPTAFLRQAAACGVAGRDGLGMLVEQAAAAFELWRGVRPETATLLAALRAQLSRRLV
jgi:shikimate dehydrogenase